MTERKAFWHALTTVIIAAGVAAGFFFFLFGPHSKHWLALAIIIVLPALFMLPFVYSRYLSGSPRPAPPASYHYSQAILYFLIAVAFVVLHGIYPKVPGFRDSWGYTGVWLIMALYHLYRAYAKRKVLPVGQ
jgi:O-antigen/teichoic acid export membrane protein